MGMNGSMKESISGPEGGIIFRYKYFARSNDKIHHEKDMRFDNIR